MTPEYEHSNYLVPRFKDIKYANSPFRLYSPAIRVSDIHQWQNITGFNNRVEDNSGSNPIWHGEIAALTPHTGSTALAFCYCLCESAVRRLRTSWSASLVCSSLPSSAAFFVSGKLPPGVSGLTQAVTQGGCPRCFLPVLLTHSALTIPALEKHTLPTVIN